MSRRKKKTLCFSIGIFIVLCTLTFVSYQTNIRLMPKVETFSYTPPIFEADEKTKWYLPEEAFFVNSKGDTVVWLNPESDQSEKAINWQNKVLLEE